MTSENLQPVESWQYFNPMQQVTSTLNLGKQTQERTIQIKIPAKGHFFQLAP